MVVNRLMDPCSKLRLMAWKETVYRPAFEALQLQHFYRALDVLAEHKEAIEDRLFARMWDLFWLKVDLVFWQLMDELAGTENRIVVERQRYNELVRTYNTHLRRFPGVLTARMLGFVPRHYFQADPDAREALDVDF